MDLVHPAITIIPARMASTRFPGKMLASETGSPLIRHVWDAARRARLPSRAVIATDDPLIQAACRAFGAECVMTSPDHPNGTSRLAEACAALRLPDDTIIVNMQGDEPEIDPTLIDTLVETLRSGEAPVATIASPMGPREDAANPNIVKVVCARDGTALYFSRALIPHDRDGTRASTERHASPSTGVAPLRHAGLYAYRRAALARYITLPETPLERTEKLEQLRWLEHGMKIAVAVREARHAGIDTPEQYAAFVARWKSGASND